MRPEMSSRLKQEDSAHPLSIPGIDTCVCRHILKFYFCTFTLQPHTPRERRTGNRAKLIDKQHAAGFARLPLPSPLLLPLGINPVAIAAGEVSSSTTSSREFVNREGFRPIRP